MHLITLLVAAWVAAWPSLLPAQTAPPQPVRLIFDTDMGNDVDDAMALAIIHALESRGECELLAVTVTKDNEYAAPFVDLMNTFYGRGNIPIGMVRGGVTPDDGKYIRQVVTATDNGKLRYPHDLRKGSAAPDAVKVLRRTLAAQSDGSVVVVMVGFSTNMARLLDSKADKVSPLNGMDLIKRKVRLLSTMAGVFGGEWQAKHHLEFNLVKDLAAARKVFAEWPTPVVASGFEIGMYIQHPPISMRRDYGYVPHHPLQEAYAYYRGLTNPQPTFDLTSVMYAVRPDHDYFDLSAPGRITVEADGFTTFKEDPAGPHRFLRVTPAQIERVREAQALLCSQPPAARGMKK